MVTLLESRKKGCFPSFKKYGFTSLGLFVFMIYKLAFLSLGFSSTVVWCPFSDSGSGTATDQLLYVSTKYFDLWKTWQKSLHISTLCTSQMIHLDWTVFPLSPIWVWCWKVTEIFAKEEYFTGQNNDEVNNGHECPCCPMWHLSGLNLFFMPCLHFSNQVPFLIKIFLDNMWKAC